MVRPSDRKQLNEIQVEIGIYEGYVVLDSEIARLVALKGYNSVLTLK